MTNPAPLDFERSEARDRKRRQWIGFGALVLLVVMLAALVASTMNQARIRNSAEAQHVLTQDMLLVSSKLQLSIHAAGRAVRGYMITNEARSLLPFVRERNEGRALVEKLGSLAGNNADRRAQVAAIGMELDSIYVMGDRLVEMQQNGAREVAIERLRSGRTEQRMASILGRIDALAQAEIDEQRLHADAASAADRRQEILTYSLAALALVFLGIAGMIGVGAARAHVRAVALSARLHYMASHDELTGLLNRRSFFAALQRERDLSARTGRSLAVAIVDIDLFKRINDSHGHRAGDIVLTHVATLLTDTLRSHDLVGRIGGEEFAVLMPHTEISAARTICERLRRIIARSTVPLPSGVEATITISTGIATFENDEDRDSLMGRADHALYAAKSGGRNQVRLAA
ncbi:GGDEF domain-containing protein [Sphingomonas sp. AX6]|uniref:GGDEF domain-containing protein n=1 Tax=Sphingomonas sp. AX6 TaxID=2653171 RepID=UPI0013590C1A|nr:diguanylate cyclase [Sphingomonas sp. AX6]